MYALCVVCVHLCDDLLGYLFVVVVVVHIIINRTILSFAQTS